MGDDDPTRILRFDISAELAQPRGDLADRQSSGQALRIGWMGVNVNSVFSIGGSFRVVATAPKVPPERSELFLDLVGLFFRVAIPVAPQLRGFIEADPSLVGMHVPCDDPTSFTCNGDGFEFQPRVGITGRVGGIYEAIPGRLDLYGYGSLETTFPEEGGWLSLGVGLTVHYGPTLAEVRRRQRYARQPIIIIQQPDQRPRHQRPAPPSPPPLPPR